LLAEHGFDVEAIDGSPAGLAVARETAAARGLSVSLHNGFADALPYPDADFDYGPVVECDPSRQAISAAGSARSVSGAAITPSHQWTAVSHATVGRSDPLSAPKDSPR
jgi:hypothetical protein